MRSHLMLLSLSAAVVTGCGGSSHEASKADAQPPADVRIAVAQITAMTDASEAGGVVQAQTSALVASRIMATVRDVRVVPGDRVRRGQVLVVLDDRDLAAVARQASNARQAADEGAAAVKAELAGAQAGLTLAKTSYDRIATLKSRNSATAHEFDQATAALRGAEARLSAAEAQVRQAGAAQASAGAASEAASVTASFGQVVAPFDGLVTEKLVEAGNLVTPGTPLVRVEDTRAFRLDVRVDESRAAFVRVGDTVPVAVDAPDRAATFELAATVKEVARAVDADARSFLVKLALPEANLRSGAFGRARLPGAARKGLSIPVSSVVRHGQVATVFSVDGDRVRLRMVHLGATTGPNVEVLAGLSEGDRVVDAPPAGLADGRLVKTTGAAGHSGSAR